MSRIGKAGTEICRGCPAASRSMAEAAQDHPAQNNGQGTPTDRGPLRIRPPDDRARGGWASQRLEDDSLARRESRLVGVALLGDSRATIPSLSGRQTAGQAGMVIGGVAGVGKGANQVLPM